MRTLRLDALTCGALKPIDLVVPAGEYLALHGKSGTGKTLLLRAIADLDKAIKAEPKQLAPLLMRSRLHIANEDYKKCQCRLE